jgi:hypothetical protein
MSSMAAAGFNTVHMSVPGTATLALAHKLGLSVIAVAGPAPLATVARYRSFPAVVAWSIADDVDIHSSPPKTLALDLEIRHADPSRSSYVTLTNPDALPAYAGSASEIGIEMYPIVGYARTQPLAQIFGITAQSKLSAAIAHRTVLANIQVFRWRSQDGYGATDGRWPTAAEVRVMTYLSLAGGAQGILYYTYQDKFDSVLAHPAVWQELRVIASAVDRLGSFLASGRRLVLGGRNTTVVAAQWTLNHQVVVIVVNTAYRPEAISIPLFGVSQIRQMSLPQPQRLNLAGQSLTGEVGPLQVDILSGTAVNPTQSSRRRNPPVLAHPGSRTPAETLAPTS